MSSSVQAAHSPNHHQFHTIHAREHSRYQDSNKMLPGPNSNDHLINIHPIHQPPVTTSRQISEDSDIVTSHKDGIEGRNTPKDFVGKENPNDPSQASFSVITPREDFDRKPVITKPFASTNTAPLSFLSSTKTGKNLKDDVVRQAVSASSIPSSTRVSSSDAPPSSQIATDRDTVSGVDTNPARSNIVHPAAASQSTTVSSSAITTHNIEDRSPRPSVVVSGTKRKNQEVSISPSVGSPPQGSGTPMSRRDSLPMGLRNKKMKATDCLLFAATLLEQDAAEALVAASISPSMTKNVTSLSNGMIATKSQAVLSLVPPSIQPPTLKKTKPLKKRIHEKIERSLQELALQKNKQNEQQPKEQEQENQQEDGDSENKPKDADVLCGRGGKVNKHPGNIVYRKVVEYNKSYYQSVHKKHRILVSQSIVKAILNYGGRFMGQKGKEWTPICFKRAVQKTSQALRERSNTSDTVMQPMIGEHNQKKQGLVVEAIGAKN